MPHSLPIAIIGRTGQLGRALAIEALIQDLPVITLGRRQMDLDGSIGSIERQLEALPPVNAIINAAAYTRVDQAEKEANLAHQINEVAPEVIAKFCRAKDIPFIHISTDYVFGGEASRPYRETDAPAPINAYGRSKLAGEAAIEVQGGRYAILRTSWLYDGFAQNFFTTMLGLAAQGRAEIPVVDEQIGLPIHARELAKASLIAAQTLIKNDLTSGIYHVTSGGAPVSWAAFAQEIFVRAPETLRALPKVKKIPTSAYPTDAQRPAFSVLDNTKFQKATGFQFEDWRHGIDLAWAEYGEGRS